MAQTDAERRAKQAEERATLFANDPAQLRENLTTTNTRRVGKDQEQKVVTKSVDRAKLRQAQADFQSRGEGGGTAEAQNRGAGGGAFATQGDFGPGAIRLNTVTAVNSKVNGR
jgi:hypothetical protein